MDQDIAAKEQPRYIKLNERDNVAIVVNDFGLPAGSRFTVCAPPAPEAIAAAIASLADGSSHLERVRRFRFRWTRAVGPTLE